MKPYRILITGSRTWEDVRTLRGALNDVLTGLPNLATPVIVVHGDCPHGADRQASVWVRDAQRGPLWVVTEEKHPAKGHPTEDFGPWPGAGPRRNAHMVRRGADLVLAFIGPCTSPRCRRTDPHPSHGASGCADLAEQASIETRRFTL